MSTVPTHTALQSFYYHEERQFVLKYKQSIRRQTQSPKEIWETIMVSRFSKITQE